MTTRTKAPTTADEPAGATPNCDNHPATPAVWSSDGVKHSIISFCKTCLAHYESTRAKIRAR
jgi:hypothetical protein